MVALRRELLTIVVLLIVLLAGCAEAPPPGDYAVIPLGGQAVTPGIFTYGAYRVWVGTTPSPTPTPTASPTSTPTASPSMTPTPSVAATVAPSATNTPTYTPSPTTATQTPTDTHTPIPTTVVQPECYGTVITTLALNVRNGPSTQNTVIAKAQPGQRWRLYEVVYASDQPGADEWVKVQLGDGRTGWLAAYYQGQTWVRYEDTPDCLLVRFPGGVEVPPDTPQPPSTAPPATSAPVTPGPILSPTPDTAPITPPPTSEYPFKVCALQWQRAVVARAGPGLNETQIGSVAVNDLLQVERVQAASGYVWAKTARGWSAFYHVGSGEWWAYGGPDGALCEDVPGWEAAGLGPPPGLTAVGLTVVTGAHRAELEGAGNILKAAGVQPAATVTCDDDTARFLADLGWRVNFRPCYSQVGDLPITSLPASDSARARVEQSLYLKGTIPAHAVQLTNEWQAHDPVYLRDWILAAVAECDRQGVTCIPVMFNPGTPPLEWLEVLRPAFRAIKTSGHYLGMNLYPVMGYKLSSLNSYTLWTSYRYRLLAGRLGPDMPRVWVSEAAEGRGESPPDLGDMAGFTCATYGELAAVNFWYTGLPLGHWAEANLRGYAAPWAVAVVDRLKGGTCGR